MLEHCTTDREISDVIDVLLQVIPPAESTLRRELEKVKRDAAFVAPEDRRRCWLLTAQVMANRTNAIAQDLVDRGTAEVDLFDAMPAWCGKAMRVYRGEVANA